MSIASEVKETVGIAGGPLTLRQRAIRGVAGAAVWVLALWAVKAFLVDLPESVDQGFWPLTWILAFVIFVWLLVR